MKEEKNKKLNLPSSSVYSAERKKAKTTKSIRYFLFAIAALLLGIALSVVLFFNIDSIEVEGSERYSAREIIDIAGIKEGENFFLTDVGRNASKVTRLLPYISTCTMKRRLPGRIIISVTEESPVCTVKTDEGYAVLGESTKVLDNVTEKMPSIPLITGIDVLNADSGVKLLCETDDETVMLSEILSGLSGSGIENVSLVDVSDNFNISLYASGRIRIDIGNSVNVTSKLKRAREVIGKLKTTEIGVLDVTAEGRVSFLPAKQGETIFKNSVDNM